MIRHHNRIAHSPTDETDAPKSPRARGFKIAKRHGALLAATIAVALPLAAAATTAHAAVPGGHGTGATATGSAGTAWTMAVMQPLTGGYGYVTDGNLRSNPNTSASIEDTIYNQWVNITCWIDGGDNGFGSDRWFKAQYYGLTGYLSSGVVSSQPSVGHC